MDRQLNTAFRMETSIKDYLTVQVQNTVNKNSKQIWFKLLKIIYKFLKQILFEAISGFGLLFMPPICFPFLTESSKIHSNLFEDVDIKTKEFPEYFFTISRKIIECRYLGQ